MKNFIFIFTILISINISAQKKDSCTIYLIMGSTKLQSNNYEGALNDFTNAVRINPNSAEAHKQRGLMNYLLKNYSEAIKDFNNSLAIYDNCGDCDFYLSAIHEKMGKWEESEKNMEKVQKLLDYQSAQNYINSGNIKYENGDYINAEADYSSALNLYPDFTEAIYQKAAIKFQNEIYEEAIIGFNKTISLDSTYFKAYAMRGIANYKLHNNIPAYNDLSRAIELSPSFATAYYYRGNVSYIIGKNIEACSDWKKAYDLGIKEADEYFIKYCK